MAVSRHPFATKAGYSLNSTQKGTTQVQKAELALTVAPVLADVYYMMKLPANHVPVECTVWADDLDSNGTPTLALDVGLIDTKQDPSDTTDADCFMDGATVGQAVGRVNMTSIAGMQIRPVPYDRFVAITIAVAAATFAAGDLILQFESRPKQDDAYEAGVALIAD